MLRVDESPWGRSILASFACAKKLEKSSSPVMLYRQEPSYMTDSELTEYLKEESSLSNDEVLHNKLAKLLGVNPEDLD